MPEDVADQLRSVNQDIACRAITTQCAAAMVTHSSGAIRGSSS